MPRDFVTSDTIQKPLRTKTPKSAKKSQKQETHNQPKNRQYPEELSEAKTQAINRFQKPDKTMKNEPNKQEIVSLPQEYKAFNFTVRDRKLMREEAMDRNEKVNYMGFSQETSRGF